MLKKIALLSGIVAAGVLSLGLEAKAVKLTGSNLVSVYSCERSGSDIRVKTSANASSYILTSSCRDAGHGLRNYTLTCTSATQYRVQWSDCSNSRPTDTVKPQLNAAVTYTVVSTSSGTRKVVPTLSARATDTSKVTKIELFYSNGSNYRTIKSCSNNSTTGSCTYTFTSPTSGSFYATAWDEAGNSVTSDVYSF